MTPCTCSLGSPRLFLLSIAETTITPPNLLSSSWVTYLVTTNSSVCRKPGLCLLFPVVQVTGHIVAASGGRSRCYSSSSPTLCSPCYLSSPSEEFFFNSALIVSPDICDPAFRRTSDSVWCRGPKPHSPPVTSPAQPVAVSHTCPVLFHPQACPLCLGQPSFLHLPATSHLFFKLGTG